MMASKIGNQYNYASSESGEAGRFTGEYPHGYYYDLTRQDNKYKFDDFGNIGEPTNLDVVVNSRIADGLDTLDVISKNKEKFLTKGYQHYNCYFFYGNIIRLMGQPIPLYTVKENTPPNQN